MTKEEFTQKMNEITSNLSDQGKVTATLTELYNGFEEVFDSNANFKNANEKLTKDNDELRKYNFDLFKQVGVQNTNDNNSSEGESEDKEQPKMKFEDLFDEKGDFKQ